MTKTRSAIQGVLAAAAMGQVQGASAELAANGFTAQLDTIATNSSATRMALPFGAQAVAQMKSQTAVVLDSVILLLTQRVGNKTIGAYKIFGLDGSRAVKTREIRVHDKAPRVVEFTPEEYLDHAYVALVDNYLHQLNLEEVGLPAWTSIEEMHQSLTFLGATVVPADMDLRPDTKDKELNRLLRQEVVIMETNLQHLAGELLKAEAGVTCLSLIFNTSGSAATAPESHPRR